MKKILSVLFILFSMISAQAGLKEWIHGVQPAPTPGPPDAKAAEVSFAAGVATDKPILEFMQAFAEALRVHDGAALKPKLAANFTLEDLASDMDPVDILMRGITQMKPPSEIVVTAIESDGDARVVKTEMRSTDRPPKTRTFRFNSDGKLLRSNLFTAQRHGFGR